ncbi:MAG: M24 family metallopeptidase [Candidatus Bathyarchaeia archaeon]
MKGFNSFYPIFSKKEYEKRHDNIRKMMIDKGLACLVVAGSSARWNEKNANIRYISNWCGKENICSYIVFPLEGEPTLLLWSTVRLKNAKEMSFLKDIRGVHPHYAKAISERIKELRLEDEKIGIEGIDEYTSIPLNHYQELRQECPKAEFKFVSIVSNLRLIKSPEEIGFMKRAAQLCDMAIETFATETKIGMKDYEVYAKIEYAITSNGGESPSLLLVGSTSMSNPRMPFPFIHPTNRTIENGDVVLTEITARYGGYWAQTHKTLFVGEPLKEYRELFDVALESYMITVEELRPGNDVKNVLRGKSPMERAGLSTVAPVAHGIGMEAPEDPVIGLAHWPPQKMKLKEGMTFTVEPNPSTEDFSRGVFLGDTFVITGEGAQCLHKKSPEMIMI